MSLEVTIGLKRYRMMSGPRFSRFMRLRKAFFARVLVVLLVCLWGVYLLASVASRSSSSCCCRSAGEADAVACSHSRPTLLDTAQSAAEIADAPADTAAALDTVQTSCISVGRVIPAAAATATHCSNILLHRNTLYVAPDALAASEASQVAALCSMVSPQSLLRCRPVSELRMLLARADRGTLTLAQFDASTLVVKSTYPSVFFHVIVDLIVPLMSLRHREAEQESRLQELIGSEALASLVIMDHTDLLPVTEYIATTTLAFDRVVAAQSEAAAGQILLLRSAVVFEQLQGTFAYSPSEGATRQAALALRRKLLPQCRRSSEWAAAVEALDAAVAGSYEGGSDGAVTRRVVVLDRRQGGRSITNLDEFRKRLHDEMERVSSASREWLVAVATPGEGPFAHICGQIAAVQWADVVTGVHGSQLTLAAFMRTDALLYQYLVGSQCRIAGLREFAYAADLADAAYAESCIASEDMRFTPHDGFAVSELWYRALNAWREWRDRDYYVMDFEGVRIPVGLQVATAIVVSKWDSQRSVQQS